MVSTSVNGGRRGRSLAAAATVVLLVVGVLALVFGFRGQAGPPQPESAGMPVSPTASASASAPSAAATDSPSTSAGAAPSAAAAPSAPSATSAAPEALPATVGPFIAASSPTGIEIPSIGLSSTNLVDLGIGADGVITVPGSADEVGFYTGGPTPGQLGPAVFGAHVDSKEGPGVFYRLGAVKAGATVTISRADGSRTTFRVDKVASYPKDQFPTEEVYRGSFSQSEIRLVTCGGPFDKVKHYLDNVIVFGHLESAT